MSIIDSVKSENESQLEVDTSFQVYSAKTNSLSWNKHSASNSFIDSTKDALKKPKAKTFSFSPAGRP